MNIGGFLLHLRSPLAVLPPNCPSRAVQEGLGYSTPCPSCSCPCPCTLPTFFSWRSITTLPVPLVHSSDSATIRCPDLPSIKGRRPKPFFCFPAGVPCIFSTCTTAVHCRCRHSALPVYPDSSGATFLTKKHLDGKALLE